MKLWRETFGQAQSKWQLAGWLLAFAFPVFALVLDKAASTIYAVFFLAGLWLLVRGRYEKPGPLLRWVLIAFTAYFLVGVLSFFLGEQTRLGEKILGRDIRFLCAVPVFFVLSRYVLCPPRCLQTALIAGGVITGVIATIQVIQHPDPGFRAGGESIAILFGHLASALFVTNVAMAVNGIGAKRPFFIVAAACAMTAVVLSGTRGAMFAALTVLAFHALLWAKGSSIRIFMTVMAVIVAVCLTLVSGLDRRIVERIHRLSAEIGSIQVARAQLSEVSWPDTPACINSRGFLEWVIQQSQIGGRGELRATVVKVDEEQRAAGEVLCEDEYLISLHNSSTRNLGWIYLPPRSLPTETGFQGSILASGNAQISFGDTPLKSRIELDSKSLRRVHLKGADEKDARFLIVLEPGARLYMAPFVNVAGEYKYSWATNSTGARLAMWNSSADVFFAEPLLGAGVGALPSMNMNLAAEGKAPWYVVKFDHAHNEILTVAAERGILGLITLFGVYAAPFWLFWRRRDVFGHAGMAFVASIFISGLTETIFNHSLGITYYCMLVLLLATAPRESPGEAARPDMPSDKLI